TWQEEENVLLSNSTEKRATITKFYNRGNLQHALSSLNFSDRMQVAFSILLGLAFLHDLNIFHSDLKESNIFLECDPVLGRVTEAVIGDFGFACDLDMEQDRIYKNGCIECRAPEIVETNMKGGTPIDERILAADIYAMGLILEKLFNQSSIPKLK